jgi:uncharacterized protein (DUF1800 family)
VTRRVLDLAAARHVLRRLCFGAAVGEAEALVGRDAREVVHELVENATSAPTSDEIRLLLPANDIGLVQGWWIDAMLGAPAQRLRERFTLTWHDHFATSHAKVQDVHLAFDQNQCLRERGLGDFRELLHALVVDPAMLVWLDGVENKKGHPNENLARELMELFALGIGNYDERDVEEAARGLSGWSVRERRARFSQSRFDDGEKQVLGVRGRLGTREVTDAVLASAAAPRWIARRLWNTLHASAPTASELDGAAARFVACEWNVGRFVVELASDERFLCAAEHATRLSSPVEFVVRAELEVGARLAPVDAARRAAQMGQALFLPPSVKGWDGGRAWFTSTAWIARQRFAAALAETTRGVDFGELFERTLAPRAPSWRREIEDLAREDARAALAALVASPEYQLQ